MVLVHPARTSIVCAECEGDVCRVNGSIDKASFSVTPAEHDNYDTKFNAYTLFSVELEQGGKWYSHGLDEWTRTPSLPRRVQASPAQGSRRLPSR